MGSPDDAVIAFDGKLESQPFAVERPAGRQLVSVVADDVDSVAINRVPACEAHLRTSIRVDFVEDERACLENELDTVLSQPGKAVLRRESPATGILAGDRYFVRAIRDRAR